MTTKVVKFYGRSTAIRDAEELVRSVHKDSSDFLTYSIDQVGLHYSS